MDCAGEEAALPESVRALGPAPHLVGPGDVQPWVESWRALEQLHRDGKIRVIGVSNFNTDELRELVELAEIKPMVLQGNVWNVFFDPHLMTYINSVGIMFQSYSAVNAFLPRFHIDRHPEGSASRARVDRALDAVTSFGTSLAEDGLNVLTPSQLVIAHLTSRGIGVIPRSANPDHIASNARAVGAVDTLSPRRKEQLATLLDEWLRATHGVPSAEPAHSGEL